MKKTLLLILSLIGFLGAAMTTGLAADQTAKTAPEKTVGIVLPLDHVALRAIISGFEQSLAQNYPGKIHFEVENAEHDLNIQRSIIQKFINQKVDLIVPLATSTTQMAMTMTSTQPIIGLAANFPESIRDKDQLAQRFTVVPDEIDGAAMIRFIHAILPNAKKITLIYSTEDKVIRAVDEVVAAAQPDGITVQRLMISNLSDLYASSQRVAADSQAIFILKDNLVASGINTLSYQANKKRIPLITSDEGTVSSGAAVALGVEEKQIGIEGGQLAARVLSGESMQQMPIQPVKDLEIFLNEKAAAAQGLNIDRVKTFAQQNHYTINMNPQVNK